MNLSKIKMFKNFIYLFIFSLFVISCEPEEVPVPNNQPAQQFENIFGETGDQAESTAGKNG